MRASRFLDIEKKIGTQNSLIALPIDSDNIHNKNALLAHPFKII